MNRVPYRWPNVKPAPTVKETSSSPWFSPLRSAGRPCRSSRASISHRPTRLDVSGTSVQRWFSTMAYADSPYLMVSLATPTALRREER